ncbi:MAG TPA: SDR family oxidoreductase [Candidatus Binataceae bacterium]|nr:SDR family oxidoreductase [Candidatus Binataceae bacterium]
MSQGVLAGKVAIVTGAGSPIGLGRAITLALIGAGARVAMVDINQEWLQERLREMHALGGSECAIAAAADVTDPEAVEQAVQTTIKRLGGLHILFNNAGANPSVLGLAQHTSRFWELSPQAWSRVIAINFTGPFLMARAVAEHMRAQRWGRIIGVTTSLDTMYRPRTAPYGPSKAGHEAFIAVMAQELEGSGVTANVLVPGGAANTNLLTHNTEFDRSKLIAPSVMGPPAVWLCSDAAAQFNGRRIIAQRWDEKLPLDQRLANASAPAAWPQLGRQAVNPQ